MHKGGKIMTHPSIACIIPARGGSKRLPRKNIKKVLGKPMLQWAAEACLKSKFLNQSNIFVSSEDEEIIQISKEIGVKTIRRPAHLAADHVWTQEVIKHAIEALDFNPGIVVRIQANSPQIEPHKIDECIQKLLDNDLWEVFTVNKSGIEDAAIHVMLGRCVFQNALSVYKGVVVTDYIDIHTAEDLHVVERMISNRNKNETTR